MGGGGWYYVPKVWSPAGGWWATPKNANRNAAIAVGCILLACTCTGVVSATKERRPIPPAWHIPSQRWAVHAKEDDPSLED